jgi:hypothetical protein
MEVKMFIKGNDLVLNISWYRDIKINNILNDLVQYKICTFVETNQDMENQLKSANILNAYKVF